MTVHMPGLLLLVLAALCGLTPAARAESVTVDPVYSLELRFTVPHPLSPIPWFGGSEPVTLYPDMLFSDFRNIQLNSPIGVHTASLFDGETLLGVIENSLEDNSYLEAGGFISNSSAFYAGPGRQTVVDFSSILDGTIEGRLLYSISQGSFVLTDTSEVRGFIGAGLGGLIIGYEPVNFSDVGLIALDPTLALGSLHFEVSDAMRGKRLQRLVELAQTYDDAGDPIAACAVLGDFIYQVERLTSAKKPRLTGAQGSSLRSHAEAIIAGLGCN